jgi:hypothetical protein
MAPTATAPIPNAAPSITSSIPNTNKLPSGTTSSLLWFVGAATWLIEEA